MYRDKRIYTVWASLETYFTRRYIPSSPSMLLQVPARFLAADVTQYYLDRDTHPAASPFPEEAKLIRRHMSARTWHTMAILLQPFQYHRVVSQPCSWAHHGVFVPFLVFVVLFFLSHTRVRSLLSPTFWIYNTSDDRESQHSQGRPSRSHCALRARFTCFHNQKRAHLLRLSLASNSPPPVD